VIARVVACIVALACATARADDASPWLDTTTPVQATKKRTIAGFSARGKTKIRNETVGYLAHVKIGDPISEADIPALEAAIISSELVDEVVVTLEESREGVIVVATMHDKWSWIAAPTVYLTNPNRAVGVGFVENDFAGRDQKLLLYGQLGTQTSILFAAFLDPAFRGSKLTYRFDIYVENKYIDEYANPVDDPTSQAIARSTRQLFLDAGALVGWNWKWWLVTDVRLRAALVYFRDAVDGAGKPVLVPEKDGRDVTIQPRLTIDHRFHYFGVTWGPYLQVVYDQSIPGLDQYGYFDVLLRAYYSWRFFHEHELEVRTIDQIGYHLPLHEELALGGVSDLRGYQTDQFRGDINLVFRAEYSVPLVKWTPARWLPMSFRGLAFWDTGYDRFLNPRPDDRLYLGQSATIGPQLRRNFVRNDVGAGLRVYLKSIVLPLVGFDVAYGVESKNAQLVFELGLTDF
jgi:outer membrane protein assembly factor BamA